MIAFEQWVAWNAAGEYTCFPYAEVYELDRDRIPSWHGLWREAGESAFVLESGKGGRYTFIGAEPLEWIEGNLEHGVLHSVENEDGGGPVRMDGAPLEVLRKWTSPFRSPKVAGLPKLSGGIAGYLAYDVVRTLEKLPNDAAADSLLPDYWFMRVGRLWAIDHEECKLYCAVHAFLPVGALAFNEGDLLRSYEDCVRQAARMKLQWDGWIERADGGDRGAASAASLDIDVSAIPGLEMSLDGRRFQDAVRAVQQYIAKGDVFQVNLSVRQSKALTAPPEDVYETLRLLNPSPYMAYLRLPGNRALVSASPELLVRLEDGRLSTRPIAGTRPRGMSDTEDEDLQRELLLSEKERAEHIMLVDLERNDLGRIAAYGTVRVKELMAVERYSHVMHIVSEVEGTVAEGKDAFDVIAAVFPGGTITGAPKIRTMEIIEELEPVRRGPYTGSIGWIDYNGNMELNITIRTLVYAGGRASVQSGAGIVIDSVPENEFRESLNKAKALWKAVEMTEREQESVCHRAETS
ncbi:anthranilate synthase component I family protein [Paenibacillus thermotolerans]|uniref:anthranilate synthase component I family protein n=1 Tax=Paenibacillus thermotolerans TaxID=3027807 RepID=UPI0023675739|nr:MULTISPECIES: anthranilate synthase component I family protein [unclassified Paenibacillus]